MRKLNILIFGAHPDDAEITLGGMAILYRRLGHRVKMISATKGCAGHHRLPAQELVKRRALEVTAAAAILDVEYEILPNDDCRLTAGLEYRDQIIRAIRQFKPDLIFSHDLQDYHPDHRALAQLVMDSSYLISVPRVLPDVPVLEKTPYYYYIAPHTSQRQANICIGIDDVWDQKIMAIHQHVSQFYEWLPWINKFSKPDGIIDDIPTGDADRLIYLENIQSANFRAIAEKNRSCLTRLYGEAAKSVRRAEAVYSAPFGLQMAGEKVADYFPFFAS
jgi:N-acetylglucosamine malate deacetylase 1